MSRERQVAYTGLALPQRLGDRHAVGAEPRLRRECAAIDDSSVNAQLGAQSCAADVAPGINGAQFNSSVDGFRRPVDDRRWTTLTEPSPNVA